MTKRQVLRTALGTGIIVIGLMAGSAFTCPGGGPTPGGKGGLIDTLKASLGVTRAHLQEMKAGPEEESAKECYCKNHPEHLACTPLGVLIGDLHAVGGPTQAQSAGGVSVGVGGGGGCGCP